VQNISSKNKSDYKLKILVLQTVAVTIILLSGVALRLFGGEIYKSVSKWYHEKFDDITLASEVLDPENLVSEPNISQKPTDSTDNNTKDFLNQEEYDSEIDNEITGNLTDIDSVKSTVVAGSYNRFEWPLLGTITSQYGWRKNPITGQYANHNGLDIAANTGTDIVAAYGGTVSKVGYSSSYGNYVIIDHGGDVQTLYAHCSKIKVEVGQSVKKGEIVALVGSTGRSTGPHLHFEVTENGVRVNPLSHGAEPKKGYLSGYSLSGSAVSS
jgi:murein DD-endopeptidase MepM/ murein hydrolase activator NlpD